MRIGIDAKSIIDGCGFVNLIQFILSYLELNNQSVQVLNTYPSQSES